MNGNGRAKHSGKIRILLVDDHDIIRDALVTLLSREQQFEVVDQLAEAGSHLFRATETLKPDLLILDAHIPGYNLTQDVHELFQKYPTLRILILSASEQSKEIVGLLGAGVQGYVHKGDTPKTLVNAICTVANGGRWVSPQMLDIFLNSLSQYTQMPDSNLTPRELDVLRVLAKGNTNSEIGEELFISEQTVKNHVHSVFKKLGVETRVEAVLYAVEHGLASPNYKQYFGPKK